MLDVATTQAPNKPAMPFRLLRLVLGYIIAVAAGSILFALVFPIAVPDVPAPHSFEEWLNSTLGMVVTTFVLGFPFGLPYTLLGLIAFRSVLPRTMPVFLAVGALCPAAAIATLGLVFGLRGWFNAEKFWIMVFSLPSGLVAAYLFGAIGLGFGFRRWRIDASAS